MQLRNLLDDDDAVSPVIGVILMVAITVILAAVIATFVLGLGEQVSETAPQATFSFEYEEGSTDGSDFSTGDSDCSTNRDGRLTISHSGGATIDGERLTVGGASGAAGNWDSDLSGTGYSEVSAGDSVSLCVDDGDTVSVNWMSQTGQDSSTLRRWSGPEA